MRIITGVFGRDTSPLTLGAFFFGKAPAAINLPPSYFLARVDAQPGTSASCGRPTHEVIDLPAFQKQVRLVKKPEDRGLFSGQEFFVGLF